ncbi:MAG: MFS transporter [Candidatus Woesearchaeota archaeon]|nr:MAG: MFS transporter [Candidatus Woesearchaeota archaeon]
MKQNLPLIFIIGCLMWGRFFIPVLALFYVASQVTVEQFSIIFSVFALTTLLLEVPSGVIADLLGKKKTLLIARSLYVIEIIILAFYNGFWLFFLAKVISGVGVSLSSGTNSSLLFDTLKRLGREKEHKKISGKLYVVTSIASAVVFLLGGYLFSLNAKLPALASLPLIGLGFVLTFFLKEPYLSKRHVSFKNAFSQFREGIAYYAKKSTLKYISWYTLLMLTPISLMLSFSSLYFEVILIPVSLIGVAAFLSSLGMAYGGKRAHDLEERFGEKNLLFFQQIVLFLGLVLMAFTMPYVGYLFYFFIVVVYGLLRVVLNHAIHIRVPTSHRATLVSINNLFENIGMFLLFPVIGYLAGSYSLQVGIVGLCILFFIASIILYSFRSYLTAHIPSQHI